MGSRSLSHEANDEFKSDSFGFVFAPIVGWEPELFLYVKAKLMHERLIFKHPGASKIKRELRLLRSLLYLKPTYNDNFSDF